MYVSGNLFFKIVDMSMYVHCFGFVEMLLESSTFVNSQKLNNDACSMNNSSFISQYILLIFIVLSGRCGGGLIALKFQFDFGVVAGSSVAVLHRCC